MSRSLGTFTRPAQHPFRLREVRCTWSGQSEKAPPACVAMKIASMCGVVMLRLWDAGFAKFVAG